MRFWDASAVVRLLTTESGAAQARELFAEDPSMTVWWATPAECASALARRAHEGTAPADLRAAYEGLTRLTRQWIEVAPSLGVRSDARHILRRHRTRTADALQLAAALTACDALTDGFEIVTADRRMAAIAELEGFTVIDPTAAA